MRCMYGWYVWVICTIDIHLRLCFVSIARVDYWRFNTSLNSACTSIIRIFAYSQQDKCKISPFKNRTWTFYWINNIEYPKLSSLRSIWSRIEWGKRHIFAMTIPQPSLVYESFQFELRRCHWNKEIYSIHSHITVVVFLAHFCYLFSILRNRFVYLIISCFLYCYNCFIFVKVCCECCDNYRWYEQ